MKILFATDNFYPNTNGAATFSYRLIEGLIARGHNVSVIAPSSEFKNRVVKSKGMIIYGIRSIMIPKKIYPAGLRVPVPFTIRSFQIKKLLQKIEPDIVHILDHFMIGRKAAKVAKKMAIPLIGTNNSMPENFIHYLIPEFAKRIFLKLGWRILTDVYKQPEIVTSPSLAACRLLKNLGMRNKILPVSCGVDLKRFNPENHSIYLKKRYSIPLNKPVVLFVGRLDREKNLDVVIKAFSLASKKLDAHLVITGSGKEKTGLIKLAEDLKLANRITFTGFVPDKDLPYIYSIGNVFVMASDAELQSIATMEAMASGLPVIAANVMALPELVRHGQNGYLFKAGDYKALAGFILKILGNTSLRKKMSANSLKIIHAHDLKKTIENFENIYKSLNYPQKEAYCR